MYMISRNLGNISVRDTTILGYRLARESNVEYFTTAAKQVAFTVIVIMFTIHEAFKHESEEIHACKRQ